MPFIMTNLWFLSGQRFGRSSPPIIGQWTKLNPAYLYEAFRLELSKSWYYQRKRTSLEVCGRKVWNFQRPQIIGYWETEVPPPVGRALLFIPCPMTADKLLPKLGSAKHNFVFTIHIWWPHQSTIDINRTVERGVAREVSRGPGASGGP